jgi:hypothetical protein
MLEDGSEVGAGAAPRPAGFDGAQVRQADEA